MAGEADVENRHCPANYFPDPAGPSESQPIDAGIVLVGHLHPLQLFLYSLRVRSFVSSSMRKNVSLLHDR